VYDGSDEFEGGKGAKVLTGQLSWCLLRKREVVQVYKMQGIREWQKN